MEIEKKTATAYVDGSFNAKKKKYGYGCVIICNEKVIELSGAGNSSMLITMRNVAGEVLAAMRAVIWAIHNDVKEITLYYDYLGVEKWATGEWKRNKEGTKRYHKYMKKAKDKIAIKFVKVQAHTGVPLNERADQLAKKAAEIKQ